MLLKSFDAQKTLFFILIHPPIPKNNLFFGVAQKTNELSFRPCIYLLEPMEEVNEHFFW
jgi:hypothetical protein